MLLEPLLAASRSRANKLGVMVARLPVLELLADRTVNRRERDCFKLSASSGSGDDGCTKGGDGGEVLEDEIEDQCSGELRADWKTSNRDEEGVWYME